ncbi:MAG: hypothetical protein IIA53_07845 [Chloroflexi bacterium]|nr:hypothetical protein [Chloroflexota bacterium]
MAGILLSQTRQPQQRAAIQLEFVELYPRACYEDPVTVVGFATIDDDASRAHFNK